MPDTPLEGEAVAGTSRPPSLRAALVMSVVGGVIVLVATLIVMRGDRGSGVEAIIGVAALVAFGVMAYGLMQAVLAVIDTAGERRRTDREVTERRQGDRARPPNP